MVQEKKITGKVAKSSAVVPAKSGSVMTVKKKFVKKETNDDKVKNLFEPLTPPFKIRIETLKELHDSDLRTYAFIGPMLRMDPNVVGESVGPNVDYVFIDKINYPQLWRHIAEKNGIYFDKEYFENTRDSLIDSFRGQGVKINALF